MARIVDDGQVVADRELFLVSLEGQALFVHHVEAAETSRASNGCRRSCMVMQASIRAVQRSL